MSSKNIYNDGYYSNRIECPKCGDKGNISIIEGKPSWILDRVQKDDNTYEYVCGHCYFRWLEKTESDVNNELLGRIENLEQQYKQFFDKYNILTKRIEELEQKQRDEKLDFSVELDGKNEVNIDKTLLDDLI